MRIQAVALILLLVGCGADGDAPAVDAAAGADAGAVPPLALGLTLHLENATFDAAYFASLDAFARTFEAHGGRVTFEPRREVVTAAAGGLLDWRTLEARGHAVGSHAAVGGTTTMTLDAFTRDVRMRYQQLAPQVTRLDHVSGNCGAVDWVAGVVAVGFKAATASTVLCMYAMAPADRPAPYQNLACNGATDATCHHSYPDTLPARIHPWRAASGAHWLTDDPAGGLVILPGSGSLPCLEEEATSPGTLGSCTFTAEAVTRALADLDAAIAVRDSAQLNTYYWVWGSWKLTAAEAPVLEAFLTELDARRAAGTIAWASVTEMYDAYLAWEATHR